MEALPAKRPCLQRQTARLRRRRLGTRGRQDRVHTSSNGVGTEVRKLQTVRRIEVVIVDPATDEEIFRDESAKFSFGDEQERPQREVERRAVQAQRGF